MDWKKLSALSVLSMLLATGLAPGLAVAGGSRAPSEEERAELERVLQARLDAFRAEFEAPSVLGEAEAIRALTDHAVGVPVTDATLVEAVKYLRDVRASPLDARESFGLRYLQAMLRAKTFELVLDLVENDARFLELERSGLVASLSPEEGMALVAREIRLDPDGLAANAEFVSLASGLAPEDVLALADTLKRGEPQEVWGQGIWDFHGIVLTITWLALWEVTQHPLFFPHNLRLTFLHLDLKLTSGISGDLFRGYIWIQLDVELFGGIGLDWKLNNDHAVLALPLAIRLELHWRLTCGWTGCSFDIWLVILFPETLIASDVVWEFAYPQESGTFPTRAESMDLLQSVYDRLGVVEYQKAREQTSASPGLGLPGLGELSTQAPPVNYFGYQSGSNLGVRNVHARERDMGIFGYESTGITAGYSIGQIRAWHWDIAIVRWHNNGLSNYELDQPPATLYYDAKTHFTRAGGNILTVDYDLSEECVVLYGGSKCAPAA